MSADDLAALYAHHVERRCWRCSFTHAACREGARLSRLLDRAGLALARVAVGATS